MIGLDKRRLDAWAGETKRKTTGFFIDSHQVHAIESLLDSIAQIIDENNREIAERLSRARIDPQGRRLIMFGDEPQSQGSSKRLVMGDEPQSQGNQDGVAG